MGSPPEMDPHYFHNVTAEWLVLLRHIARYRTQIQTLRGFAVFFNTYRQMLGWHGYFKLGHDHFLLYAKSLINPKFDADIVSLSTATSNKAFACSQICRIENGRWASHTALPQSRNKADLRLEVCLLHASSRPSHQTTRRNIPQYGRDVYSCSDVDHCKLAQYSHPATTKLHAPAVWNGAVHTHCDVTVTTATAFCHYVL
jgi:hypothetical protein